MSVNRSNPSGQKVAAHFVDLAKSMPDELTAAIGELTVLFGRLEHMVLLVIKRKRDISVLEAQSRYKGYSLGSKIYGKRPCTKVGELCQNHHGEIGLKEIAGEDEELSDLCNEIIGITTARNRLLHGLVTTVVDEDVIFHKSKVYSVQTVEFSDLQERVIEIIERLNEAVPVPGLSAAWASGPEIDMRYEESATTGADPLVKPLKSFTNE